MITCKTRNEFRPNTSRQPNQLSEMYIYKERKNILLKVRDKKSHFTKYEGHFERFSLTN